MSSPPSQRAGVDRIHAQVRKTLDHAVRGPIPSGHQRNELYQSLFDLEKAITDFNAAQEVTLLGDNVGNAHVFCLLNNALPEALQELNYQLLLSHGTATSPVVALTEMRRKTYCEIFQYFTFSTRIASDLIEQLVPHISC